VLFRRLPIADAVFRLDRLPAGLLAQPRDRVTLGWQDRTTPRARLRTEGGVEFGTSLAPGVVLREGDCLALEQPPLVVLVCEREEAVLVVRTASAAQAARWAYCIGNSHQPLMVADDVLICADVPGMEQVLAYHSIPFTREQRTFTPESPGPEHHR
jgi:urease accessory protein UreE